MAPFRLGDDLLSYNDDEVGRDDAGGAGRATDEPRDIVPFADDGDARERGQGERVVGRGFNSCEPFYIAINHLNNDFHYCKSGSKDDWVFGIRQPNPAESKPNTGWRKTLRGFVEDLVRKGLLVTTHSYYQRLDR